MRGDPIRADTRDEDTVRPALQVGDAAMDDVVKFDAQTDLFVQKLQRTFHWYVNARTDWPAAGTYQKLVDEIEQIPADEWPAMRDEALKRDRALSSELLGQGQSHYSIRYTEVMAVHSDYLLAEKGDAKNQAARRWVAFRQQIDAAKKRQ